MNITKWSHISQLEPWETYKNNIDPNYLMNEQSNKSNFE